MKSTIYYLDEIPKVLSEVKNDSQIAAALGISRQAVSLYRGGTNMNVLVAVRVAYILGLHPMETISATMYAQTKDPEEKRFWETEYKKTYRP
jgi:predicted transcriptional regulator